MEWKDLSYAAKSILEWMEDPFSGKKHELYIKLGERITIPTGKSIEVNESLFSEIRQFCKNNTDRYDSMTSNKDIRVSLRS